MGFLESFIITRYKRILAKESKGKLQAEFPDEMGRWWSTFRDTSDMPIGRLAQMHTGMQFLGAGLTGQHFADAMEIVEECFAEHKLVLAGAILHDLKELPKTVINIHAMINVIAVQYIRADEDPNAFNKSIHQQKCDWILEQAEKGSFFLSHPSFKKLLLPFGISGEQLIDNLHVSIALIKKQTERLAIARSMKDEERSNLET